MQDDLVLNCLNADRIWASTPQIADYTDYADYADFKTFCCEIIAYLSGLKTRLRKITFENVENMEN